MSVYVGVDGGGTKTMAMAMDVRRGCGFTAVSSAANPNSIGWDSALLSIDNVIASAMGPLGVTPDAVTGVCVAMAGVDREIEAARVRVWLGERFTSARIEVVNDALAALCGGTRGEGGVVLIAGTGSIAVGEDETGRVIRAGGHGYLVGDEGSGFWIGRRGIMAGLQAAEGRGPQTELWPALREKFGVQTPTDLIPRIYGSDAPVSKVAAFAEIVLSSAERDAVAAGIVEEALDHHARLVHSVTHQLMNGGPGPVVATGGLYRQDRLIYGLRTRLPSHTVERPAHSAAAGAVLRALHSGTDKSERRSIVDTWERIVAACE